MAQENLNNLGEDSQKKPEGGQEEIKNETKKDLVKDLESADYSKLVEQVGFKVSTGLKLNYNNSKEVLHNGYTKISINRKGIDAKKDNAEVIITIKTNGDINIRFNPYDHFEEYHFIGKDLDLFGVCKEIDGIEEFHKTGVLAEGSSLKKIETIPNPEEFDLSDYLNDDQIPGDLTQENYEKIEKTEGVEAAVKFADVNKDKKN